MAWNRITRDGRTVALMIRLYCRSHHAGGPHPCDDCAELEEYARERLARCPYGERKPTCSGCATVCYGTSMRGKIRAVMRYAGPRMPFAHPIETLRYFADLLTRAAR